MNMTTQFNSGYRAGMCLQTYLLSRIYPWNIHIGSVSLDNTAGGAALFAGTPDATDGDCLDIEPDSFDGSVPNRMTIDYLKTKGAGNDFTAGTTAAVADAMVVTIGKWDSEIVSRASVPWHTHYGITLNIGDWNVWGITSNSLTAPLYYSCRLNVGTAKISAVKHSKAHWRSMPTMRLRLLVVWQSDKCIARALILTPFASFIEVLK